MYPHPDQTMTLTTIHLGEIAAEVAQARLVKTVIQAQQPERPRQTGKIGLLHAIVSHFQQKLSLPAWQAVFKHG